MLANILNDPRKTNLISGKGGFLVPASQRYNAKECRNVVTNFVILNKHVFPCCFLNASVQCLSNTIKRLNSQGLGRYSFRFSAVNLFATK